MQARPAVGQRYGPSSYLDETEALVQVQACSDEHESTEKGADAIRQVKIM